MIYLNVQSFLITFSLLLFAPTWGLAQVKEAAKDPVKKPKTMQPASKDSIDSATIPPGDKALEGTGKKEKLTAKTKTSGETSENPDKSAESTESKPAKSVSTASGNKAANTPKTAESKQESKPRLSSEKVVDTAVKQTDVPAQTNKQPPEAVKITPKNTYNNNAPTQPSKSNQSTFNKTYPGIHADGVIVSEVEISCESVNNCNAKLMLRMNPDLPISGEKYRGFHLPRPKINIIRYQLQINSPGFRESADLTFEQVLNKYSRSFTFHTTQSAGTLAPKLIVETDQSAGAYGPATVDAYYKTYDEINKIQNNIERMEVNTNVVLAAKMEELDGAIRRLQEVRQEDFMKRLPLSTNDPAKLLFMIDQIGDKIRKKEQAYLKECLQRISKIETSVKLMKIMNPDQIEKNDSILSHMDWYIKGVTGLKFNPNNSLLGTDLNLYHKNILQLEGDLKLAKESLSVLRSKRHEVYFEMAMTKNTGERRSYLQKAIDAAPKPYADPNYELALLDFKDNNYPRSLNELDQAINASPKQATYDKCIDLYNKILKDLIANGDLEYGEKAIRHYERARNICKGRNIPIDCEQATVKIRNARTLDFKGRLITARNSWDFEGVASARSYFITYREEIEGDQTAEINRTFSELIDRRFSAAASHFQKENYPGTWDRLLDIKKLQQQYQIEEPYPQRWENLAKLTFEDALFHAENHARHDSFQRAAPLVALCKKMREDVNFVFLFQVDEHAFKTLYSRVQKGLFEYRLQEAGNRIKHDDFAGAETLLQEAETQQNAQEASWWLETPLRDELQGKRRQLASSRFFALLNKVEGEIDTGYLHEAEKGLIYLEKQFQLDLTWLSPENHGTALKVCQGKYYTAKTYEFVRKGRDSLSMDNFSGTQIALLDAKSILHKIPEPAVIAREAVIELQQAFLDKYIAVIDRILDSLGQNESDTALLKLRKFYDNIQVLENNEYIHIESQGHKIVLDRLRKKIFSEECRQSWNRFASEMESAEEMVAKGSFIQVCQHAQKALDALKGKPDCKLDQSSAEKMLDKYQPAADYQRGKIIVEQSLQNLEYDAILTNYSEMESIYSHFGLSDLNIRHLALIDFITQAKDKKLIAFTVGRYYTNPAKKGLLQVLLSKEHFEGPNELKKIGAEVGEYLKRTETSITLEGLLNMHQLEPEKNDQAFKSGLQKGYKKS